MCLFSNRSQKTSKCGLMKWKPMNSRLMKIRTKEKHIDTIIIQGYVSTNDSEEESKDAFYDQLQAELESTPRHEMKIVMGDLNAKLGIDNTNHDRAMGKDGCGIFGVKVGVRQGCPMSALLFNLTIAWVMRQATSTRPRGIRWTLSSTPDDLGFADDLTLATHSSAQAKEDHPSQHVCTTSNPKP